MKTEPASKNSNLYNEIIQWGCECIVSLGYTLKSNLPEKVRNTPWSYVIRFETSVGYLYLKHTPDLLALEASITQILHDKFCISVAEVIAHNADLNSFLMKDAGKPLREILQRKFDVDLFCSAIVEFTSMQLVVQDHVSLFFDRGVPDWRLDKLPHLYMQCLRQREILIAEGLSEKEISELEALLPKVGLLCQKLSEYGIQQSIVQPDFHDNNILIADRSQNITFIDLGESVISHPFFSLINCLRQIKQHHALTDTEDIFHQLMDACLYNFTIFGPKKDLLDAFAIACRVECIYRVLSYIRLMCACDKSRLRSFYGQGRLSSLLKELMAIG